MKKKIILIASIVFFVAILVAGYYFLIVPKLNSRTPVSTTLDAAFGWKFPTSAVKFPSTGSAAGGDLAYSSLPNPAGVPSGLPITLNIPVIGVNSAIEDALITPDGRMDVPAGTIDVAWFALGPQPGSVGSAVIGGHYGIQNNVPFVFYDLNKLRVGDNVYITNDEGDTFTFVVRSTASYGLNADATTVFTSTDGLAHLNLITCEGIWNEVDGNYPDRLVVFTDLVSESKGGVPSSTSAAPTIGASGGVTTVTFSRLLAIGASGTDVIALQTFLEQRGLLQLPSGVSNGSFGTLTSAALAQYQTSVGLSPVGVVGPLTRAKLNLALSAGNPILPNTGEAIAPINAAENPPVLFPMFVQFVENLYATPTDGIVTSILLIAIVFVVFKIIWL